MLILRNFIKTNRQLCEIYLKSNPNTNEVLQNQCSRNVFTSNLLVRCSSSSVPPINKETSSNEFHDPNLGVKIYHGTLSSKMKAVKLFSLSTSAAGLAAQPILLEEGAKLGGTPMAVFLCGFAGFFTFVTPVFLHFITKKYVTEIHYNPAKDEYTATTISLFLRKNLTKFQTKDVDVPDVPGMFTTIKVRQTPLFIDVSQFFDPKHYAKIMGYDKPIDFKLNLTENDAQSGKKG